MEWIILCTTKLPNTFILYTNGSACLAFEFWMSVFRPKARRTMRIQRAVSTDVQMKCARNGMVKTPAESWKKHIRNLNALWSLQLMLFYLFLTHNAVNVVSECLFRAISGNTFPSSLFPTPSNQCCLSLQQSAHFRRCRGGRISIIPPLRIAHCVVKCIAATAVHANPLGTGIIQMCCAAQKWCESFYLPFVRHFSLILLLSSFHNVPSSQTSTALDSAETLFIQHRNGRPILQVSNSMQILICY